MVFSCGLQFQLCVDFGSTLSDLSMGLIEELTFYNSDAVRGASASRDQGVHGRATRGATGAKQQ